MYNILEIIEDKNQISLKTKYPPVICGNSNYYFTFTFDEEWSEVQNKTAIFEVLGKKQIVEFSGTSLNVPVMPNASSFLVSLVCSPSSGVTYTTNAIKIKLKPNFVSQDIQQSDPMKNYYSELKVLLDKISDGDIVASSAVHATTSDASLSQVSLTGNENISGNKNFTGQILQNNKPVTTVEDVANINLLINPSMKINQRGKTEYQGLNVYGPDRWKLGHASSSANYANGIWKVKNDDDTEANEKMLISQTLEDISELKGKTITATLCYGGLVSIPQSSTCLSIYDGVTRTQTVLSNLSGTVSVTKTISSSATTIQVEIRTTENNFGTELQFYWCKLEVGDKSTTFVPRLPGEEIRLCQRYFQNLKINGVIGYGSSSSSVSCSVYLPVELRTSPTLTTKTLPALIGNGTFDLTNSMSISYSDKNLLIFSLSFLASTLTENELYLLQSGVVELDSEI